MPENITGRSAATPAAPKIPPKPTILPLQVEGIPAELRSVRAWVGWKFKRVERNGVSTWTKVPINLRTGGNASSTNEATWVDFETALRNFARYNCDGIGTCVTPGKVFIDLDDCLDNDQRIRDDCPWAKQVVDSLAGRAYIELSPSGQGLHLFTLGELPPGGRVRHLGDDNGSKRGFEFYDIRVEPDGKEVGGKYFAVTGSTYAGSGRPLLSSKRLATLHAALFPPAALHVTPPTNGHAAAVAVDAEGWRAAAAARAAAVESNSAGARELLTDDELLDRARAAKDGAKFRALFDDGNISAYGNNPSAAHFPLCHLLAFWCGPDPARIDRLYRRSALYTNDPKNPAKWDRVGEKEIAQVLAEHNPSDYYEPKLPALPARVVAGDDVPTGDAVPDLLVQHSSDYGNGLRLIAMYGERMRYCHAAKAWLHWRDGHWASDEEGRARARSQDTIVAFGRQALEAGNEEKAKFAARCLNSQRISNALQEAQCHLAITPQELDRDPFLFNCLNGTIELRTGKIREHRREDYITKLAPVVYDPAARSELWEQFLDVATGGDKEMQAFLQRAVGYSLTGDTREEVLFFVHGPEHAGKSTFLEAIKATLGDYAKTADFETFVSHRNPGIRDDIAELAGRRFVVSIEVDEGKKLAEGLVKMVTGGDTVRARFLYRAGFEFMPPFKLWLAANHAPKVRDDDGAMWRRILRTPFEHKIPNPDPTVKQRLRDPAEQGPAILAWAVAGCLAWQKDGLQVPEVVKQATAKYREDMDPLKPFFDECCKFGPRLKVVTTALKANYEKWCADNHVPPITGAEFNARLRARNCEPKPIKIYGKQHRGWIGVGMQELPGGDDADD